MKLLLMLTKLILFISILIMIISTILSKKSNYDKEKISPFECGFNPKNNYRNTFSIQFFLIAIIFLIFDVEITLLLPLILTVNSSNLSVWFTLVTYFILILILGLLYEWKFGALDWLN
uniref:NADH-ubiquinone oxidoreductase chain 3 n=1 Tax=Athalia sikkimensis TaxID=2950357 RepID=A0A977XUQ7_9HYME|nr:NADH dehydrogenase subunit 3 [Athalia sikkimensis]UXW93392.1 NADH dehydrogenase subunit 3 [Athalia sikkimensis]UXW93587.1 NADH dehydrogenase subunit 3 [Athalia sikkimensis]